MIVYPRARIPVTALRQNDEVSRDATLDAYGAVASRGTEGIEPADVQVERDLFALARSSIP